jgi:hypothetical protein
MIAELAVTSDMGSSFDMMVWDGWNGFDVDLMNWCDP